MKKFLTMGLLLIFATVLVGCRGGNDNVDTTDPTGKVVISYWNPLTGPDGAIMRQLVRDFNAEHEGQIEVTEQFYNEVEYYTNLDTLVPMGKGPDVAIMHSYLVQSYAEQEIIIPIDDYVEASEIDIKAEHYVTDLYNSLFYGDSLFAIPFDMQATGIYYNLDLLNKYGLDVPTNRQELIDTAKTVQSGEKGEGKTFWGLPLSSTWPSEWIFTTSLYQNNGLEIDDEGNPAYNTPEGATALKRVTDLIHVHNISPLNFGVDQDLFLFQTGQALFHINGNWMLNSIKESGVNFGVIPMSDMFNNEDQAYSEKIHARSHTFVLPKPARNVSDAKKTALMTFIKYLGDHSYIWATGGLIPASNIARETDEYKALPYLDDFGAIEDFQFAAQSPYYHEAYSPVYSRVTSAMLNPDYNPSDLLTAAVEEANQLVSEAKNR